MGAKFPGSISTTPSFLNRMEILRLRSHLKGRDRLIFAGMLINPPLVIVLVNSIAAPYLDR